MPQRIALSHAFGAPGRHAGRRSPSTTSCMADGDLGRSAMGALGFEVMFGSLTVTGSLMAFGKLQELLPGRADHVSRSERDRTSRSSWPPSACSST